LKGQGVLDFLSIVSIRGDVLFFVFLFLSTVLATMVIANILVTAIDVRRRTITGVTSGKVIDTKSGAPGHAIQQTLSGSLPAEGNRVSQLRKHLTLAGYYGPNALVYFQAARLACAVVLGLVTAIYTSRMFSGSPFAVTIPASLAMTLLGLYLPRSIVGIRRERKRDEHRRGFPEFLDLMVICADAGVGVDSAIDRISKDIADNFPSLARNLEFMSLELRAGRTLRDALDNLSERLGIDEARSFATLLQQSEELGSSLVQSLRVYSDEMRAKRLSRAEEKAHGLPVKLVLPLGLCVFPVILAIVLLPVMFRIYKAFGL
jgi:tight adherence protein C